MPFWPVKHAGLCWDLDILRRLGDSTFAIRLVFLPTGRIACHLLLGLHVEDLVQSTLLHLPARSRIRRAGLCFDILLFVHLSYHHAVCQGDNAIDYDQRWKSEFQQDDNVVPTATEADGGAGGDDHFVAGLALFDGLDAVCYRQPHRSIRST